MTDKQDDNRAPHFNISASIVRKLGDELISDEITAILELVKNAYDADSKYVSVTINTKDYLNSEEFPFSSQFASSPGYIIIEDRGFGMNRQEIIDGWLNIGVSHKQIMKAEGRTTPLERTPLGDKGLGRLSTIRLGERLELITKKEDRDEVYQVGIDWEKFTSDKLITKIPVEINTSVDQSRKKGTKLVITNLRNPSAWVTTKGKNNPEIVHGLAQLITPFDKIREFTIALRINGESIPVTTLADKVRDTAIGKYSFEFNEKKLDITIKVKLKKFIGNQPSNYEKYLLPDNGNDFFSFLTHPDNEYFQLEEIEQPKNTGWYIEIKKCFDLSLIPNLQKITLPTSPKKRVFASPGPFSGEIDEIYLREVDATLSDTFSRQRDFSDFVKSINGVRIYRNGFGIRPYGFRTKNKLDDWLYLTSGQTSGRSYYGLRPENLIGFVAITAKNNSQLIEKTDREGFQDTPHSSNFFDLMQKVVKTINDDFLNVVRRAYNEYIKKIKESESNFFSPEDAVKDIPQIRTATANLQKDITSLLEQIEITQRPISELSKKATDTPSFVTTEEKRVATLIVDAEQILNDAKYKLKETNSILERHANISIAADLAIEKINELQEQLSIFSELASLGLTAEALSHEINILIINITEKTNAIQKELKTKPPEKINWNFYLDYIRAALSGLRKQISYLEPSLRYVRDQKDQIAVLDFIKDLIDFHHERFSRNDIYILLAPKNIDFTVAMNRGKLTQIVDNLLFNSEYWLIHATENNIVKKPQIMISVSAPFITIEDNGLGVAHEMELLAFQPFTTMKPKGGRGLGLYIVRELLDSSGCHISLLPERNQHNNRYKFQIDLSGAIDD